MKKLNTYFKNLTGIVAAILIMVAMASCEDDPAGVREASAPPEIERVSLVEKDSTTTEGQRGRQYVIYGNNLGATQMVTFNGAEADVNLALATNTTLIVGVPSNAPYADAANEIVVTNSAGSASMSFSIMQPPPIIESFTPQAAGAGDIITIMGDVFDNVEAVYFGETEAEIVSSSRTEIEVRVPEGIVQAQIRVVTPGGETISTASYGFKYIIYDDALNAEFWIGGWSNTSTFDNTENVSRGTNSIKVEYTGGYAGFQIGMNSPLDLSEYSAVKLSIYGAENVGNVFLALSGNFDAGSTITLTEGEYMHITIPLSELGNPSQLTEFVIQEYSGQLQTIYIDDIGLI